MPYRPIEIDRANRTVMGVSFRTISDFDAAIDAIGTVMFEGFDPTPRGIEITRDYLSDKITIGQLTRLAQERAYV